MKWIKGTFLIVLSIIFFCPAVNAQPSDYQVKQQFENSLQMLESSIQSANSTNILDSLSYELDNLKYQYESREKLLDKALYPQSFEGSIDDLKQDLRSVKAKIMVIENQDEKLTLLSNKLASYQREVDRLNDQTESLRLAIQICRLRIYMNLES